MRDVKNSYEKYVDAGWPVSTYFFADVSSFYATALWSLGDWKILCETEDDGCIFVAEFPPTE